MLMFRELTQEEQHKVERLHNLKTQMETLQIHRMEKRKEIEFFEERRGMDYVPVIVWGLLMLSQAVLIFMDFFFGIFRASFTVAIMFASMTPFLFIFFAVFFVKSLVLFIRKNSKNSKIMMSAKERGIENRWLRSAQLYHELKEIDASLRLIKKEYGYLKVEVDQMEAGQ